MYIPLATHSAYYLQEGLIPPVDLVWATQPHGMSAIGLTDHNLLTGTIEFVIARIEADIQPIIGLDVRLVAVH